MEFFSHLNFESMILHFDFEFNLHLHFDFTLPFTLCVHLEFNKPSFNYLLSDIMFVGSMMVCSLLIFNSIGHWKSMISCPFLSLFAAVCSFVYLLFLFHLDSCNVIWFFRLVWLFSCDKCC